MKNLAGSKESDKFIQIELEKAKIPFEKIETPEGECQYTIIGKLKSWTFKRAWYYWIASVENENEGLPIKEASEMHEKKYPSEMFDDCNIKQYGNVIRSGGHCGCPHPLEFGSNTVDSKGRFVCLDLFGKNEKRITEMYRRKNEPLSKMHETFVFVKKLESDHVGYVNCYHIDTQEGLNEFVRVLNSL